MYQEAFSPESWRFYDLWAKIYKNRTDGIWNARYWINGYYRAPDKKFFNTKIYRGRGELIASEKGTTFVARNTK